MNINLPALELLATRQPAPPLVKPTTLVLQRLLPADTRVFDEVGARRTRRIFGVARVLDGRVSASWSLNARITAIGRLGTAWLRGLKDGEPAGTGDVLEDSLHTRRARPRMARERTEVISTLQRPAADPLARVLLLDLLRDGQRRCLPPLLLASSHPLLRLLLHGAASLFAEVPPAVQGALARPRAPRCRARVGLGASELGRGAAAAARDVAELEAGVAGAGVARALALVTAGQRPAAHLIAARDLIGA